MECVVIGERQLQDVLEITGHHHLALAVREPIRMQRHQCATDVRTGQIGQDPTSVSNGSQVGDVPGNSPGCRAAEQDQLHEYREASATSATAG
jgi:hypothetical protein